ncbi:MAG: DUF4347 domain-containing protein, partial [Pseudomonadota bacterium]
MAGRFNPIFQRHGTEALEVPKAAKPLMRVLEPRVLLDAAAVETALDIAGQATHSQLADDYAEAQRDASSAAPLNGDGQAGGAGTYAEMSFGASDGLDARRTDREVVFIDANIEDRDDLIASLEPGAVIHVLAADGDGVEQIARILEESGG